jgi:hypothetical protein
VRTGRHQPPAERQRNDEQVQLVDFLTTAPLPLDRTLDPDSASERGFVGTHRGREGRDHVESMIDSFNRRASMSVAKVSEISATSSKSFEDAVQQGLARSAKTLRNVRSAWIKEQHVRCTDGRIAEYQVNMMVTFVLDD